MPLLPEDLHALAQRRHDEPHRGYHGWSHPQALLALAAEITDELYDPVAVEAAILFHDAIYDPRAGDNERRSAELADRVLAGRIPDASRARAVRLIDATARHAIPDGLPAKEREDMARFLDLDLSILGAPPRNFDAYEAGVRHEYAHVPAPAFAEGRSNPAAFPRTRPALPVGLGARTLRDRGSRQSAPIDRRFGDWLKPPYPPRLASSSSTRNTTSLGSQGFFR